MIQFRGEIRERYDETCRAFAVRHIIIIYPEGPVGR